MRLNFLKPVAFRIKESVIKKLFEKYEVKGNNTSEKMRNLCHALSEKEKQKKDDLDSVIEMLDYDISVLKLVMPVLEELIFDLNKIWLENEPSFKLERKGEGNLSQTEKEDGNLLEIEK